MSKNQTSLELSSVPPQLFALGMMLEGQSASPMHVREGLKRALNEADRLIAAAVAATEPSDMPNAVEGLAERIRAASTNDEANHIDAAEQGLYLGLALAFRYVEVNSR